jgi:hypothetical protein
MSMTSAAEPQFVPLSPAHLRVGEALPFSVYDDRMTLLLAAGQIINTPELLAQIGTHKLLIEEGESLDWRKRLLLSMNSMVTLNVTLKDIAAARPMEEVTTTRVRPDAPLNEQWEDCISALDAALKGRQDDTWLMRVLGQRVLAQRLVARRPDASLYYQFWRASQPPANYSAQHALFVMMVVDLTAPLLGLETAICENLGEAALMMNIAMIRLQDELALSMIPPSQAARQEIAVHPQKGALMLKAMGVDHNVCHLVAQHHTEHPPITTSPPLALAAQLLRRVDILTAKLSRRRSREPLSAVQAARGACLGPDGKPDVIGSALLKALGLYPPGTYLQLASGEQGVVMARGRSPSHPMVAVLLSSSGMPVLAPALRDTSDPRFAVKQVIAAGSMKVRLNHGQLMGLI